MTIIIIAFLLFLKNSEDKLNLGDNRVNEFSISNVYKYISHTQIVTAF